MDGGVECQNGIQRGINLRDNKRCTIFTKTSKKVKGGVFVCQRGPDLDLKVTWSEGSYLQIQIAALKVPP